MSDYRDMKPTLWRRFYLLCNKYRYTLFMLLMMACFLLIVLLLTGCGSTSNRETRTVETTKVTIPAPIMVDLPVGRCTLQPGQFIVQRELQEVEQTVKTLDMPDALPLIQAVAATTPWGALVAGLVGTATTAYGLYKAKQNGRQRDEVIDGAERAKDDLSAFKVGTNPDGTPITAWDHLTTALEAEQNDDTKAVVRSRTT